MIETIQKYIESLGYGYISFAIEMVILVFGLALLIHFLCRHVQSKSMIVIYIAIFVLFVICLVMGLKLGYYISAAMFILTTIYTFVFYIPEYKTHAALKTEKKETKQFLTNEDTKMMIIDTLVRSVDYLSSRKIGAIITIEKEHTLNNLIEGAVELDAEITFELLESIFHPNTALHDGAVIIRGDRIKCASAFFQPSQKKDIPQHYGSRHRAAIGISEQSDAFTIVVSEETGQVANTIGGTITGKLSLEGLRTLLEQHLIVKE